MYTTKNLDSPVRVFLTIKCGQILDCSEDMFVLHAQDTPVTLFVSKDTEKTENVIYLQIIFKALLDQIQQPDFEIEQHTKYPESYFLELQSTQQILWILQKAFLEDPENLYHGTDILYTKNTNLTDLIELPNVTTFLNSVNKVTDTVMPFITSNKESSKLLNGLNRVQEYSTVKSAHFKKFTWSKLEHKNMGETVQGLMYTREFLTGLGCIFNQAQYEVKHDQIGMLTRAVTVQNALSPSKEEVAKQFLLFVKNAKDKNDKEGIAFINHLLQK